LYDSPSVTILSVSKTSTVNGASILAGDQSATIGLVAVVYTDEFNYDEISITQAITQDPDLSVRTIESRFYSLL
jgi:hypothetical protein